MLILGVCCQIGWNDSVTRRFLEDESISALIDATTGLLYLRECHLKKAVCCATGEFEEFCDCLVIHFKLVESQQICNPIFAVAVLFSL